MQQQVTMNTETAERIRQKRVGGLGVPASYYSLTRLLRLHRTIATANYCPSPTADRRPRSRKRERWFIAEFLPLKAQQPRKQRPLEGILCSKLSGKHHFINDTGYTQPCKRLVPLEQETHGRQTRPIKHALEISRFE